jgi:hypothetical protein
MTTAQQQHTFEQTAASGFKSFFGGVSVVNRKAQAIAGEFAKLSQENLEAGANAAARLRDARSLQDVTTIQSELLKKSYETTIGHYRKIAELAISAPQEFARSAREFASGVAQTAQDSAEHASDGFAHAAHEAGARTAEFAEKGAEAARTEFGGGRG